MSTNNSEIVQPNNGYTAIVIGSNYAQKHPLRTVLSLEYLSNLKNVGQALNYMLENSGSLLAKLQTLARKL